jgi:hypothetical protein
MLFKLGFYISVNMISVAEYTLKILLCPLEELLDNKYVQVVYLTELLHQVYFFMHCKCRLCFLLKQELG